MKAVDCPRSDRGETSVQTVLLVPVVLSILFLTMNAAVLAHAGEIASLAANRGAQLIAAGNGDSLSVLLVRTEIARTIDELGSALESEPQFSTYNGSIAVTVRVKAPNIVPFLPRFVTRRASAPLERFINEQDRR